MADPYYIYIKLRCKTDISEPFRSLKIKKDNFIFNLNIYNAFPKSKIFMKNLYYYCIERNHVCVCICLAENPIWVKGMYRTEMLPMLLQMLDLMPFLKNGPVVPA